MATREEKLAAVAEMALLFHRGGPWAREDDVAWCKCLVVVFFPACRGSEATTRVLCDAAREALLEAPPRETDAAPVTLAGDATP